MTFSSFEAFVAPVNDITVYAEQFLCDVIVIGLPFPKNPGNSDDGCNIRILENWSSLITCRVSS